MNSRRARFAQKYAGLTPEQTLGESYSLLQAHLTPVSFMLSAVVSKGWRSSIYEHFLPPKIIRGANGAVIHRFTCKK